MNILLFLILICIVYKIQFAGQEFHTDYMAKEQTTAINGLFVFLIFFSHYSSYVELGAYDNLMETAVGTLGQLIVVPFLFYSGYGVMHSLKNKENYYVSMPFKRIFRVWYHFAIAVALFIPVAIFLKKDYSIYEYILAFTGWTSIGNSNWYVFAILCMYLFTYFGARLFRNNHIKTVITVFAMSAVYILLMKLLHKGSWWYDTVITYTFGMLFALYGKSVDKVIQKNGAWWGLTVVFSLTLLLMLYFKIPVMYFSYIFALWIVLVTAKFKIVNGVLVFLGNYTFEIYILQRIPLQIFPTFMSDRYVIFILSFISTVVLAVFLKKFIDYVDDLIYKNKEC